MLSPAARGMKLYLHIFGIQRYKIHASDFRMDFFHFSFHIQVEAPVPYLFDKRLQLQ